MLLSTLLLVAVLVVTSPSVTCDNLLRLLLDARPMMDIMPASEQDRSTSGHVDDVLSSLGEKAKPCDLSKCRLPSCKCSNTKPPGNMKVSDIPQMVVFTFQNAITDPVYQHYVDLFAGRRNPNNCPAVGTFFVQHNYTNYFQVQSLWSQGHEIGDNTVTFQTPTTYEGWKNEMESEAQILNRWAELPNSLPAGFRAPFLQLGGNEQFSAIRDTKLWYDASRPSVEYSNPGKGYLWPYTYDYMSTQDCVIGTCPTNAYPGVWQIPLAVLWDKNGSPCTALGQCVVENEEDVYNLLGNGLIRHHITNRAPYILTVDAAWMETPFKKAGTLRFLDELRHLNDTYVVSGLQALQWTQRPTELANLKQFKPWDCSDLPRPVCSIGQVKVCQYDADRKPVPQGGALVLRTCVQKCPPCYPALGDPFGLKC